MGRRLGSRPTPRSRRSRAVEMHSTAGRIGTVPHTPRAIQPRAVRQGAGPRVQRRLRRCVSRPRKRATRCRNRLEVRPRFRRCVSRPRKRAIRRRNRIEVRRRFRCCVSRPRKRATRRRNRIEVRRRFRALSCRGVAAPPSASLPWFSRVRTVLRVRAEPLEVPTLEERHFEPRRHVRPRRAARGPVARRQRP